MKTIYIAGTFTDASKIDNLKKITAEETDYTVPCVWWKKDAKEFEPLDDGSWFDLNEVHEFFNRDIDAIEECDIFLIKFSIKRKLRGALVELGNAYGIGKRTIGIGPKEKSCMMLAVNEWYHGIDDLIKALKEE